MPKENLKDKLDGNSLDISLSSLSSVPVNELALLPKATHIDLSCNILSKLPEDFCTLAHIVHLDLSKNQLLELPRNFGELRKLQHLDLLGNKLTSLPVSVCHLKNLKWLDLKDNPLKEPLKSIVGDCLDEKQCRACARNVLDFMKRVQAEQEKQYQKKLQEEREKEEKRKAEEELQKQQAKEEKKREKQKRRKEHEERLAQQKMVEQELDEEIHETNDLETKKFKEVQDKTIKSGLSCCGVFMAAFIGLIAVIFGLYFYCSSHLKDQVCQDMNIMVDKYWTETKKLINKYT